MIWYHAEGVLTEETLFLSVNILTLQPFTRHGRCHRRDRVSVSETPSCLFDMGRSVKRIHSRPTQDFCVMMKRITSFIGRSLIPSICKEKSALDQLDAMDSMSKVSSQGDFPKRQTLFSTTLFTSVSRNSGISCINLDPLVCRLYTQSNRGTHEQAYFNQRNPSRRGVGHLRRKWNT